MFECHFIIINTQLVHQIKHPILKLRILILFFHKNQFGFFKIGFSDKKKKQFCLFWFSNENLFWTDQNKQQISWKILGFVDSGLGVWSDVQAS